MKAIRLEFYKCKRRKVLLVCLALIAAQLIWMGVFLARLDEQDIRDGWMLLFYNLALVDAIMLPLTVAVLASRNGEAEHRGMTFKLLETLITPARLYAAKLCWGALMLCALLTLRTALFIALGAGLHFAGGVPWGTWALFTLISWAVSMMVYALQQALSLRFANQAVALIVGLCGSFAGLLSMLFPLWVQRCMPWGYYGLLLLVGMNWNETTHVTTFFWRTPLALDVGLLVLWGAAFLVAGFALFMRKEE